MTDRMKVWPNRLPVEMIDAWESRARAEGVPRSVLLRHVLQEALERPGRIMPDPTPPNPDCGHETTIRVGYTSLCRSCRQPVE